MDRTFPNLRTSRVLLLAGAWALVAGCRDEGIATYRIPKEPDSVPAPAPAAGAPTGSPALSWNAPSGWVPQPAGGMRLASFLVSGAGGASANVSVVSFPGSGGDDLANINRWRNQVKLPPISAADLPGQVQSVDAAAGNFVVADLAGTGPDNRATRILGAWLRQPDRVWFFKMMGPSDLVGAQKAAFMAFLKSTSLTPRAVAGQPQSNQFNTNDLPVNAPAEVPSPETPAPSAGGGGMDSSIPVQAEPGASLLWSAPAGWQVQTGNPVRKGSFAVGGGAEVAVRPGLVQVLERLLAILGHIDAVPELVALEGPQGEVAVIGVVFHQQHDGRHSEVSQGEEEGGPAA